VPSRFLQRLAALAGAMQWSQCKARGERALALAQLIDGDNEEGERARRPKPMPKLALRPVALSVTRIETLRRDPYSIYAERILQLKPLEPIGAEMGARLSGVLLHEVLSRFVIDHPKGRLVPGAEAELIERARDLAGRFDCIAIGLGPGSYAGVRIAIATAIGLAMATGARLVGIPSVAAWECDLDHHIAIGDARRETFYFTKVERGTCTEGPLLTDAAGLLARIAALPGWPVLSAEALDLAPQAIIARPNALTIARLAAEGRGICAEGDLEPLYLREPHITQPKVR
jgi:tRNA threonylcarbamoyl adenosine modification protein YeaZ